MKFSMAVLLLLCCVAVKSDNDIKEFHYRDEQIIENEIQSEEEKGTETSVSSEQICKPDIHTVLRELSTKLAEQSVELRYTKNQMEKEIEELKEEMKKQNEEAEIRLKASETQLEELKRQNEATEIKLEELKKQNEATEIRLKASETQVEELKRENGGQTLELRSLQMKSNITEDQVRELRKENSYKVAFSASTSADSASFVGPFNTEITLKYTNVFVNNGNAYNPNTGIFTAPVRGVYMFRYSITGQGRSSSAVGAQLLKNIQVVVRACVDQPSNWVSTTNGASLLLEVGDVVYVQLETNRHIYESRNHFNTFSGQLLFTV